MTRSSPTTLRDRFLRLGLLIAIVKLVAVATLVWTSMRLSHATSQIIAVRDCAITSSQAMDQLSSVRRNVLVFRLTGEAHYLEEAAAYRRLLEAESFGSACTQEENPRFALMTATAREALAGYFEAEEAAMELPPGSSRAAVEAEVGRKFQAARTSLDDLYFLAAEATASASGEAVQVQEVLLRVGTVVGIGSILLVGSLLIVLRRDLVVPMYRLTEAIRKKRRSGQMGGSLGLGLRAELGEVERAVDELSQMVAEQRTAQYSFIAAVAHDLKNPLQSIRAYSSFVRDDKPLPSEAVLRKGFAIITKQTDRLNRQLEDLLDAARIQAGALEVEKRDVDLGELVNEVGALAELASDKHRIELFVPESLHVSGDATRLGQVLTNLLNNAVKYSPQGGCVRVRLTHEGNEARITVTDEGIGIDREHIKHLFEPFHRLEDARTRQIPGIGLGLATSRWIVEAHGGHIEVESEPGHGATFTVSLPMSSIETPREDITTPDADDADSHSTSEPPASAP